MVVTEFDYDYYYSLYLIEEEYNEALSSSTIASLMENANIDIITEGVIDGIKGFVDKIVQAIKTVWTRFTETMKDLFSKDKEYLSKYKETITKKPVLKTNIANYYKYDIEKIRKSSAPGLVVDEMIKYDENIDFIKAKFPDFVPDNNQTFKDKVRAVFRGGEAKTISSTDLNMKEIFNYLEKYFEITKDLESDISIIEASNKAAYMKIKAMGAAASTSVKTTKKAVTPSDTNTSSDQNSNAQTTTSGGGDNTENKSESFNYDTTMTHYFNEAKKNKQKPKPTAKPAGGNNDGGGMKIEPVKDENKPEETKTDTNDTTSDSTGTDLVPTKNAEQAAKEAKAIKMYYKVCADYLGIRLQIAREAYKAYMKITKWHVSQYVKDSNKAADAKKKKEARAETKKKVDKVLHKDGENNE